MEVIPNGRGGQIVLLHVEEEDAVVIDNVPILCHNIVAKIVWALGQQLRQKTVIQTDVQVNITFVVVTHLKDPKLSTNNFLFKRWFEGALALRLPHFASDRAILV